ncbi:HU family DNA-binding protein [Spiroplasma ixodetis]|uniref:HU family DNA-binding protein n=1 Tax=Spiroplasma ixodetis TaxID=2141 RepID=UPI002576670D|nr:HU family DNA-binding protein [Spiroplasma ixodetis]WJG71357.1 DNA-binding protein HU-beta [Spiroplasma ixodetis Y32]
MNKKELVKAISNEINLSQKDVENCIDKLAEIIIAKNSIGEFVDISNLGKFMIVKKNARTVRNPRTGQTLHMSEHYSPKFQPKSIYKQTIKSAIIQKETEVKTNV